MSEEEADMDDSVSCLVELKESSVPGQKVMGVICDILYSKKENLK